MKIAVLFGGTSEERDVSIASAAQVIPALRGLGHDVIAIDTATGRLPPDVEQKMLTSGVGPEPPSRTALSNMRESALTLTSNASDIKDVDVVFLALHGGAGEDGRVQAVLDLAGLAYTGSNHIASATAITAPSAVSRRNSTDLNNRGLRLYELVRYPSVIACSSARSCSCRLAVGSN